MNICVVSHNSAIFCVVYFQRAVFGQILMAIDNIAEKCHRHMDPDLDTMTLDDKLNIIKVC